jgi:hypothetical protein
MTNTSNKKEVEKREIVYVHINDIIEFAKKIIMERHGGIGYDGVEYADKIDKLKFTIPKKDREGLCNEITYFESEKIGKDGGCGETGGSCICKRRKGHKGDHECECGSEW